MSVGEFVELRDEMNIRLYGDRASRDGTLEEAAAESYWSIIDAAHAFMAETNR